MVFTSNMGEIKLNETTEKTEEFHMKYPQDIGTDPTFKRKVVWFNAIGFLFMHLAAVFGVFLCFKVKAYTVIWMFLLTLAASEGITIGAHRLYSHKAFKAKFITRLGLILLQTIAGQNCLYIWVRDHRQHHKYSDTDADPHNANRGFFFSHIGWLMSKKHPLVISKGKGIDMSDLEADTVVMFQKKYYKPLYVLLALILPIAVPVHFWNEDPFYSVFVCYFTRYVLQLNATWLINSATHLYGMKPYDKSINPVENHLVSVIALGEGWHNYHHVFPYDYRAAEFGWRYSVTTFIIDCLASLNLVYDLRSASPEMVRHRTMKKGDGSHYVYQPYKEPKHTMKNVYDALNADGKIQRNQKLNSKDFNASDLSVKNVISAQG